MSKIEGQRDNTNFADYRFSISSDAAETTITQNDTISSTTEFAIASKQTLSASQSLITLAPIFPVVLAKTSSNTSDTRISNGNALYFVNTQGLSNGGFLHLLNSETNSNGASITFANPGYKDFSTGVDSIDYRFEDNFGAFIWRYSGLQKGRLLWNSEYLDKVWDVKKTESSKNKMYGFNTGVTGYAIAQRINYDGTAVSFGTENAFSNHYQKLGSPESRDGFYPVIGSRFWDIDKLPDTLATSVLRYSELGGSETFEFRDNRLGSHYPQISRRNGDGANTFTASYHTYRNNFESMDGNIENFYLFSTGDIYPDSYKRTNSIGFTNRDLQKYSLIVKTEGGESTTTTNHENYDGALPSKLLNDSSFEILPIQSSNVNTSELKRFGLARLVEVTYDYHFNEVDFENLKDNPVAPSSAYGEIFTLGGVVEHLSDQLDTSRADGGEPQVTDFKIDGSKGAENSWTEGAGYYQVSLAPQTSNGGDHHINSQRLYTDYEVYNTGSTNKFGDYQAEELITTAGNDIYTQHGSITKRDGSWFEVTGIVSATQLVSRITSGATNSGRSAGTYTNVLTTNTSASSGFEGNALRVTVIVDGSGTVTSIIPHTSTSSVVAGQTITYGGAYYDNGDVVRLASADIGGGADCDFTLQTADLSTENRIYLEYEAGFLDNIAGTSNKKYNYTGRVKILNSGATQTLSTNALGSKKRLHNSVSFIHPLTEKYNNLEFKSYFNLGFILGQVGQGISTKYPNGDFSYLGKDELTGGAVSRDTALRQYGHEFFLPFYLDIDASATRSGTSKHTLVSSSPTVLNMGTIGLKTRFQLSQIFDKLTQWNEAGSHVNGGSPPTINSTTNPHGLGPSHLYTDMYGIIRELHMDDHSKIAVSEEINASGDIIFGTPQVNLNLRLFQGSTIPNLHLSFLETDGSNAWVSVKHGTNFQGTAFNDMQTSLPSSVSGDTELNAPSEYSDEQDTLSLFGDGLFNAATGTNAIDYAGYRHDNMVAMEFYLKPILNTQGSNVSILELDVLTQTTGIPSSTTVKSNTKTTGRAIIKIANADITLNANNGKDGSGGVVAFPKINQWINYVNDLTGHYLASENSNTKRDTVNNSNPDYIHKIISHTINTTGGTIIHYLEIDNVTYDSGSAQLKKYYRIMRIAKDCMFDSTPNNIELNKLSKQYTLNPSTNKCFNEIARYNRAPINSSTISRDSATNEGVLSMYVVLDVDGKPNSDYVLRRSLDSIVTSDGSNNSFTSGNSHSCLMTDGENDILNNITFERTSSSNTLTFRTIKNMKGIISIGETFDITTFNSPQSFGAKRCNLASAVDVVEEVDEIVNHILEDNNVQFETKYDTTSDMYFIGPNYTGASGFHVINDLLGLKNKRFLVNGETIEGRDLLSDNLYTNIVLSENDESEGVVNLRVDTSSYDFYNEVIVYGDNAKGVARNNRSIRDLGRKITLEITDLSLQTSKAAQDKANKELEIVEILSSQVSFNVSKTRIPYLRAGQVITLDYPSLDVQTNFYQVLEIEDNFGQLPRLTVGKYTQSLASRFADLSLKAREIQGVQRGNRFQEGNTIVQEAVIPEIKPLNLKVIKTGLPSSLLGFSNTLGFSSELGFETSSSLTEEVILNEDLTE